MLVEFDCGKIKTSSKNDVQNFAVSGFGKVRFKEDTSLIELYFKKVKEKIYFDEKPSFSEIYHPVKTFHVLNEFKLKNFKLSLRFSNKTF
jgi:hypothetical protein